MTKMLSVTNAFLNSKYRSLLGYTEIFNLQEYLYSTLIQLD